MIEKNNQQTTVQTVLKALDVLECFVGNHRALTIAQIAANCQLSRPTAYRLVTTLARRGYLSTTADGRYRLGPKVLGLARSLLDYVALPTIARPILAKLAHQVGETVYLGVLDGMEVLYLDKHETPQSARMYSVVGTRNPLYCTALGKALLAFLPPKEQEELISRLSLIKRARNTRTTRAALLADLELTRSRGYAVDDVENEEGIRCVAAPLLNADHYPIAAISVSGPEGRLTIERIASVAPHVCAAAEQIAAQLGFRGNAGEMPRGNDGTSS